jgi:hypothetical protein
MPRFIQGVLAAGLLLLAAAETAQGFGGRGMRVTTASYPVYVAPAPVWLYVPAAPVYLPAQVACPPAAFAVSAAVSPLATPTPAPPSQTSEPPGGAAPKQAPKVSEWHSPAGDSGTPAGTSKSFSPRSLHRVGFWNVSDRDMTINVEGQAYALARGRAMTMSLGRQFTWQIDQRKPTQERIPEDKANLEIVIRN